jgi:tRNA U34 2-thiouridine synthase MnmA/TrmU
MTRYRAQPADATATLLGDGRLALAFDEAQRAVTPGQLVALLEPGGDEVLAAATIERAA